MRFADIGDSERPAYPVQHVLAALLVLGATKIGQHIFKAPAGIAELPPMIKISGLAANVEQAIDRARPSQYFSSRLNDPPIVELCLRLRRVEPVDLAIGEQLAVTERDVDPDIAVVSARFQQQDAMTAGGGQTICEHAAGSAGADDDVVKACCGHCRPRLSYQSDLSSLPRARNNTSFGCFVRLSSQIQDAAT